MGALELVLVGRGSRGNPQPSVGSNGSCLALIASESWVEGSLKNHSLVVVDEAVLSIVDSKVAILDDGSS